MILKELKNPVTEKYLELKKYILSDKFPWFYDVTSPLEDGIPFFSHTVLARPEEEFPVPEVRSEIFNSSVIVLRDIFRYNNIHVNTLLRINVNYTFYFNGGTACPLHYDHPFQHKNLLIYLTNSHGPTVLINTKTKQEDYFHPQEDAIITFEGKHYHYQPKLGERRIVLVATYI